MSGSSIDRKIAINRLQDGKFNRESYMLEHMQYNKSYLAAVAAQPDADGDTLLQDFKNRYLWYRKGWRAFTAEAIEENWGAEYVEKTGNPPLCIDLESSAYCDLACPHCTRQYITTPDKMISDELAYKIIDQAAELGVPSMKFNWRGEPLANPSLAKYIKYAKEKGIIETLINSNCTHLSDERARELIDAGLDILIYSFDGGSRETYNKNRPARFGENSFDDVYRNIRRFHEIKQEMGAVFPYTKIQMVLTKDNLNEQESFYDLFKDCVDEASVGAYMERGGNLNLLSDEERALVAENTPDYVEDKAKVQYWKTLDDELYVEQRRIPCEQIFQRMMVTYDGRVFMCCYDWGNEHPIGFVTDTYFTNRDKDFEIVQKKFEEKKPGFERFNIKMPARDVKIPEEVSTLKEIWDQKEIRRIRNAHVKGHPGSVDICKKCSFKEAIEWKKLS